jgi:class 3 adenylate cyclase
VLATVLFTDIVDSTATLARIGDERWRELLNDHNRRVRDQLNQFRGREVDTTGDGFLAVFDSASRAVRCGLALIGAARDMGIAIRVGVHTGEVEFVGDNVRGVAVHAAARVLSRAGADEVFVSSTTRDLLEGSSLTFEDAGPHDLKGLSGARTLYRVESPATSTA